MIANAIAARTRSLLGWISVAAIVVVCAAESPASKACGPIIKDEPSQNPSADFWVMSVGVDNDSEGDSGSTPASGNTWFLEKIDGQFKSTARYQVVVLSDRVLVFTKQTLSSPSGKDVESDVDINLPFVIPGDPYTNTDVQIRVWRTVAPESSATGEVQFSGFNGQQVLFSGGVNTAFEEDTLTLASGASYVLELGAAASMGSTQSGTAAVTTAVEVIFCCAGSCDGGPDPVLPHIPVPIEPSCPDESTGLGLHVSNYSGRVYTQVPIFKTYAYGETECDFRLRYNTLGAGVPNFGGWTHNFNYSIVCYWNSADYLTGISLRDAEGNTTQFLPSVGGAVERSSGSFSFNTSGPVTLRPPTGERSYIVLEEPVSGRALATLHLADGRRMEFKHAADWFTSGYRIWIDRLIDRRGRITRFWNWFAGITHVLLPSGRMIRFEHDGEGAEDPYIRRIVHPDGEITYLEYSAAWESGRLEAIEDPEGGITSFEYNSLGLIEREELKNGVVLRAEYDLSSTIKTVELFAERPHPDTGLVSEHVIAKVSGAGLQVNGYDRDTAPGEVIFTDGNGTSWRYFVNAYGRPIMRRHDESGELRVWEYGTGNTPNKDRLIATRDERGIVVSQLSWNDDGQVESVTDGASNVTSYLRERTDLPEKVTREVLPGSKTWQFEYYNASIHGASGQPGDLMAVTDPEQYGQTSPAKIQFEYTTRSATDNFTLPSPWNTYLNDDYAETENLPGRIEAIERTDRRGNRSEVRFDHMGRPTETIRYMEDDRELRTTYVTDLMGRTTQRTVEVDGGPDEITEWEYDDMGRVRFLKEGPSNAQHVTEYEYDAHGLLTQVIDAEGRATKLEYDESNRLQAQIEGYGVLNLRTEFRYDGNGNLVRKFAPEHFTSNAGHVTEYEYNFREDLTKVTEPIDATHERVTDLWRDPVGNLIGIEIPNAWGDANTDTYRVKQKFDALNRVFERVIDPTPETGYPGRSGGLNLTTTIDYTTPSCSCSGAVAGTSHPHRIEMAGTPNKVTYFRYDKLNRRTAIVRKVGTDDGLDTARTQDAESQFEYDAEGNLVEVTGPEGERVEFGYDMANRRDWGKAYFNSTEFLSTDYLYDDADRLQRVFTPAGNEIQLTYDVYGRLTLAEDRLAGSEDDFATIAALTYEDNGNILTRSTAISGQTTTFGYDAANRLTSITDPLAQATQIRYDKNGNRSHVRDRLGRQMKMVYDELDRVVQMIENYGGSEAFTPLSPLDDTADTSTWFEYNAVQQTSIADHNNNKTTYDYDAALRLKEALYPATPDYPSPNPVAYTYHADGLLHTRTDQRGVVTTYAYDDLGQLESRNYAVGMTTRTEAFGFDRSGRLLAANNDVAQLGFDYDKLGRLTETSQVYLDGMGDPISGASFTTSIANVVTTSNVYRDITYPTGRVVRERRDRRDRLVSVTDEVSSYLNGVAFTYDAADRRTRSYFGQGWEWDAAAMQPQSIEDLLVSAFDYDLNDRLTKVQHAQDVTDLVNPAKDLLHLEYGYDAEGNRTYSRNLKIADRSEVYEHDQRNRLIGMQRGDVGGSFNPATPSIATPLADTYIPSDQSWPKLDRRGNWGSSSNTASTTAAGLSTTTNGTTNYEHRTHDAANQARDLRRTTAGVINGYEFDYDAAGNLTRMDLFGDLNCDGSVSPGDVNAFLLAITDSAAYTTTYPNCAAAIGDFDGNGVTTIADIGAFVAAVTAGGYSRVFTYDEENRLISANTTQVNQLGIQYDALGRRVLSIEHTQEEVPCDPSATVITSTRHVYLGLSPIEEHRMAECADPEDDLPWALAREFLWGDRFPEPLALIDWTEAGDVAAGQEEWLYYLRDVLGSVIGLATPEDQLTIGTQSKLVERYTYDPYGKTYIESWDQSLNSGAGGWTRPTQSAYGNPFLWTGQRYDSGVRLYHFLFRTYSPELGRWMQRDPVGYVDGMNLLEYVATSPLQFADPFGLESVFCQMLRDSEQRLKDLRKQREDKEKEIAALEDKIARQSRAAQHVADHLNQITPSGPHSIILGLHAVINGPLGTIAQSLEGLVAKDTLEDKIKGRKPTPTAVAQRRAAAAAALVQLLLHNYANWTDIYQNMTTGPVTPATIAAVAARYATLIAAVNATRAEITTAQNELAGLDGAISAAEDIHRLNLKYAPPECFMTPICDGG